MAALWICTCAVFQLQQKQAHMSKDINEETRNLIDMNWRALDKKKKKKRGFLASPSPLPSWTLLTEIITSRTSEAQKLLREGNQRVTDYHGSQTSQGGNWDKRTGKTQHSLTIAFYAMCKASEVQRREIRHNFPVPFGLKFFEEFLLFISASQP